MKTSRGRLKKLTREGAEAALATLRDDALLAPPHELAGLIDVCARALGALSGISYLADLQQQTLVPFAPRDGGEDRALTALNVDSTLAGRAFQSYELQVQESGADGTTAWLPMLVGTERLGVLAVAFGDEHALADDVLLTALGQLAGAAAELVAAKSPYGDTIVNLRRRREMGLAAEIQWSLMPPLSFASRPVTIAAALEPAYMVAGDTVDYAVDAGMTHVAVFDGMGHGLQSAQCAVLAVGGYRNARRSGRTLTESVQAIDLAVAEGLHGEGFTTAVMAQLDTGSGHLHWVNAGHPEPLLLRGGRLVKSLHATPRPPLGLGYLSEGEDVAVGYEPLEPRDLVLLYTDGVVEARSPDGVFFGIERLADLVIRHLAGGLPAPETMRRVVRELLDHQQGPLGDDASLLLLEWQSGTSDALRA